MELTSKEIEVVQKLGVVETTIYQNYVLFYQEQPKNDDPNLYLKMHTMYYLLHEYGIGRNVYSCWSYADFTEDIMAPYNDKLQGITVRMQKNMKSCTDEELQQVESLGKPKQQQNKKIIMKLGNIIDGYAKSHQVEKTEMLKDLSNILLMRDYCNRIDSPQKKDLYEVSVYEGVIEGEPYYNELIRLIRGGLHLNFRQKYKNESQGLNNARSKILEDSDPNSSSISNLSDYSSVIDPKSSIKIYGKKQKMM